MTVNSENRGIILEPFEDMIDRKAFDLEQDTTTPLKAQTDNLQRTITVTLY
jgi:hypothetical protein